jgi:Fe-S oxidoreductase
MAKLKSDALQMRHDRRGTPLGARLMGGMPDAAKRIAGPLAPLVNAVQSTPPFKLLLQKLAGVDRRRPLPRFTSTPFAGQLRKRKSAHAAAEQRSDEAAGPPRTHVVLFDDTYANYFEPSVGLAAVNLLEACGYRVTIAKAGCCQRPRLSKGLVRAARVHGERTLRNLDRLRGDNGESLPILCLEPSCASALKDDLADLVKDDELGRRISARVWMLDEFLAHEGVALESAVGDTFFHGHCHQRALFDTAAMRAALGSEHQCTDSNAGCCGMAGSFGYEHHDVSQKVGEDRLFPGVESARQRGETIVAAGFSCRHQLADFCDVKAKHWVECVRPKGQRNP